MRSVLFICTANICRSPTAEGVLRAMLNQKGLAPDMICIESAGTHDYQVGKEPLALAVERAAKRGYRISNRTARKVTQGDFDRFDFVLGMDRSNIDHLRTMCPTRYKSKIELLLEYGDLYHGKDVPDPYGGAPQDFDRALDMIEDGCRGLALVIGRVA